MVHRQDGDGVSRVTAPARRNSGASATLDTFRGGLRPRRAAWGHHIGWIRMDPDRSNAAGAVAHHDDLAPLSAIASNLPFSERGQVVADPRLVVAIVDRVTFGAHVIETGSDSYRLRATRAKRSG